MADISLLSRLVSGVQRQVDLSTNTLVVNVLKVGGGSGTDLTKTILDRLVSLQNGSDVDASYHTHDTVYTRTTALASTTPGSAGSTLIGDNNSYSNFTPTATTVKGALQGINTALGSVTAASAFDGTFRIKNTGDNTKQIAFDASAISTTTTRTISMPDADVDLGKVNTAIQRDGSVAFTANQPMGNHKLTGLSAGTGAGDSVRYEQAILTSGANAFSANQSMGSNRLTNLADPVSAQDAATKAYIDSLLDGRSWKQPVRVASTANIDLSVVADPSPVDGVTLANGDRILLKNQTAPAQNGIYVAVSAVDPTTWVRASDADTALELEAAAVFVEEGTASHDYQFAQTADNITLGTTALVWVVTSANSFSGHDMISLVGGQISVDLAAASGLESTNPGNAAGQLRIKLEASNPSLRFTGSNELAAKLDAAGAIISGASGLAVQVDNSTIEISSNALRVKDAGITLAKLASNSVDENKIVSTTFSATGAITGGGGSKVQVEVDGSSIERNANALRIKTTAYDQSTITGGGGSAASVQNAPLVKKTLVAGESFAANTSFLVRWGINSLSETTDRIYKADKDASSTDKFWVIGIALSTGSVSAGGNIDVVMMGTFTLGASDTAFAAGDVGKPVWLTSAGAFSTTAPSATNEADFKAGMVEATTKIWVDRQMMGVN